ncbi:actin-like protein [Corchorus capsularis]|uniref:Actin-like protein n=1 Tax=Corchorus capsularis TaxID=210143 RepID=A0A1R3JZZ7_COCAP|nr:actin-like protein [Corchorus capsularis]
MDDFAARTRESLPYLPAISLSTEVNGTLADTALIPPEKHYLRKKEEHSNRKMSPPQEPIRFEEEGMVCSFDQLNRCWTMFNSVSHSYWYGNGRRSAQIRPLACMAERRHKTKKKTRVTRIRCLFVFLELPLIDIELVPHMGEAVPSLHSGKRVARFGQGGLSFSKQGAGMTYRATHLLSVLQDQVWLDRGGLTH